MKLPDRHRTRPRGAALLMAMVVLMLLTMFMSEYFFATGLELRGMTTFREAQQARVLAHSVFRAIQIGLRMDEVDFFKGYNQVSALLDSGASIPWENGLLISLTIAPQDHLYNLNQIFNVRQGEDPDVARSTLFINTLRDMNVPGDTPDAEPAPLSAEVIEGLYAALVDWVDADEEEYIQFPGVLGAEAGTYFGVQPEYQVKNAQLDRLDEIRLVRGVRESRIIWPEWKRRFTVLPKALDSQFYFTEKINVNVASREDIAAFIKSREVDPEAIRGSVFKAIQTGINKYAAEADNIADKFAPEDALDREVFDQKKLKETLTELGFSDDYGTNYLFSTVNKFYRVSLVTEVNDVQARLEGLIEVARNPDTRISSKSTVHWVTVQ